MMRRSRSAVLMLMVAVALLVLASACHINAYDTGDSRYSYLRADFAEVRTNAQSAFTTAVTDEGDSLIFTSPLRESWATRPDTLYRALLYYDKGKGQGAAASPGTHTLSVTGINAVPVYVLRPQMARLALLPASDPVGFQSAWMSSNRKYVNVALVLKSGQADIADARHLLGLLIDGVVPNQRGHRTLRYRLYHLQNGVPAYYSTTVYASIPTFGFEAGDSLKLTIMGERGTVIERSFGF